MIPLGRWLGLDSSNNVTLATSLSSLMTQIAAAGYTIPDSLLQDQKQLTYSASQAAVTYATGAVAANTLVDSNVASVSIGKLVTGVNGTVVFASDVYLARRFWLPGLCSLPTAALYLLRLRERGRQRCYTGADRDAVVHCQRTDEQPVRSGSEHGVLRLFGRLRPFGVGHWQRGHPVLDERQHRLSERDAHRERGRIELGGRLRSTTISSTQIQMLYGSNVATTLSTLGLTIQNGSYFSYVGSTGVLLGYYPALSGAAHAGADAGEHGVPPADQHIPGVGQWLVVYHDQQQRQHHAVRLQPEQSATVRRRNDSGQLPTYLPQSASDRMVYPLRG